MKKFFAATILAVTLLVVESSAQAMPVQLYDHSVEYVISDLRTTCRELGISLWGTEYYTYQDMRRCELHFGNSDDNTINFHLLYKSELNHERVLIKSKRTGFFFSSLWCCPLY